MKANKQKGFIDYFQLNAQEKKPISVKAINRKITIVNCNCKALIDKKYLKNIIFRKTFYKNKTDNLLVLVRLKNLLKTSNQILT
jgi:hypothetical protein